MFLPPTYRRFNIFFGARCAKKLCNVYGSMKVNLPILALLGPFCLFAAQQPCSSLAVLCKDSPCRVSLDSAEVEPGVTPWQIDCLTPGIHTVALYPTTPLYRDIQHEMMVQPLDSVRIEQPGRDRQFPGIPLAQLRGTGSIVMEAIAGSIWELEASRKIRDNMSLATRIEGSPGRILSEWRWQPLALPWTQSLGIETFVPLWSHWSGSRLRLSSAGALSWRFLEGRIYTTLLSHSTQANQTEWIPGPEGRLGIHISAALGHWLPGIGCEFIQASSRNQDSWKRLAPQTSGKIHLRFEPHPDWTIQILASIPIAYPGTFAMQLALIWSPALPILVHRQRFAAQTRPSSTDTAWVADLDPNPPCRFPSATSNTSEKRLPRLSEWQSWLKLQPRPTSPDSCPAGSAEWVLPNKPGGTRVIRTGIPCAYYPEDWESVDPRDQTLASPRWWRPVFPHSSGNH